MTIIIFDIVNGLVFGLEKLTENQRSMLLKILTSSFIALRCPLAALLTFSSNKERAPVQGFNTNLNMRHLEPRNPII